jgi:hypothetical protein
MSAQNVIAFPRPTAGWTFSERALLSCLAECLREAGTFDYVVEAVTDRGDPWIAFCGDIDLDPLYTISKINKTFACHLNGMSKLLCEASTLRSLIVQVWPGALALTDIEENITEFTIVLSGASKSGAYYTMSDVIEKVITLLGPNAAAGVLDPAAGTSAALLRAAL